MSGHTVQVVDVAEVQLPPLLMHARKPSRFDHAWALVDEIREAAAAPGLTPLSAAVESLGYIAADVGSPERNAALKGLRWVREAQLRA